MTAPALLAVPSGQTTIDQAAALDLLYTAVIGERGELGRLVRDLLLLHQVLPGTGQPWPDCSACHGAGRLPATDETGPRHCHCRCDLCTCNEPLCVGPCESLGVMLSPLVLRGRSARDVDPARLLAELRFAGVRRIVAATTRQAIIDPVDGRPGAAHVTVGDSTTAAAVADAVHAEGYQCQQRDSVPGLPGATRITITPRL